LCVFNIRIRLFLFCTHSLFFYKRSNMELPADDIRQLKAKIEQLERDRSATTSDALKIAFTSDIVAKENRLRVLQTHQGKNVFALSATTSNQFICSPHLALSTCT